MLRLFFALKQRMKSVNNPDNRVKARRNTRFTFVLQKRTSMKKLIPVFIIIAMGMLLFFSSCQKNYVCKCTLSGGTAVVKYELGKKSRTDANAECEAKETSVLGVTYACELE